MIKYTYVTSYSENTAFLQKQRVERNLEAQAVFLRIFHDLNIIIWIS